MGRLHASGRDSYRCCVPRFDRCSTVVNVGSPPPRADAGPLGGAAAEEAAEDGRPVVARALAGWMSATCAAIVGVGGTIPYSGGGAMP